MDKITLEDVKRLDIRPGDRLLVKVSGEVFRDQLDEIADRFRAEFPSTKILIIAGDMTVEVIGPEVAG